MTQPALFDLARFEGPPDNLRRARHLLELVEQLGADFASDPDRFWPTHARALELAGALKDPAVREAVEHLADPTMLSMFGPEQLEIRAERRARQLVEHLERERLSGATP